VSLPGEPAAPRHSDEQDASDAQPRRRTDGELEVHLPDALWTHNDVLGDCNAFKKFVALTQRHGTTMTEILATHRPKENLMESLMCVQYFPLHILSCFNGCSEDDVRGAWFAQGVAEAKSLSFCVVSTGVAQRDWSLHLLNANCVNTLNVGHALEKIPAAR